MIDIIKNPGQHFELRGICKTGGESYSRCGTNDSSIRHAVAYVGGTIEDVEYVKQTMRDMGYRVDDY